MAWKDISTAPTDCRDVVITAHVDGVFLYKEVARRAAVAPKTYIQNDGRKITTATHWLEIPSTVVSEPEHLEDLGRYSKTWPT